MKKYPIKIFMTGFIIILFIGACIGFYCSKYYEDIYYTKVDNSGVSILLENKEYEYSLTSYNKNGKKKVLSLKTNKKLKDNAYLKLTVHSLQINQWKELDKEEVPAKILKELMEE